MRVGQKQNILEAIQVLNGPLVNTQGGSPLDSGGWPSFDLRLKSKREINVAIAMLKNKLIGLFFFICSFITVSLS